VLNKFICHDVLMSSYVIPPPEVGPARCCLPCHRHVCYFSLLDFMACYDVLRAISARLYETDLLNAPGAATGGIPRGATLQQLLRYGEALQPLDDPAARADAVNAIALPEVGLARCCSSRQRMPCNARNAESIA